ncbi:FAD-binding and (Fe-S)-binding domain-containing protein [Occallatibacter savannae]|uniref:FAD-binding and (Fe-S)-binding domain-containing protein n=1 Tax=Occallatibacter savannae TaxID=1002691 RepID=UPI000D689C63|nr:FAD-binding and (Fe-S)-binding domain-containing protein [Occallatibacter savannae]
MDVFKILNQPSLEHEKFSAHRELEARLKVKLRGDVQFDAGSRALYATDASNYRQLPVGVILPRDAADVEMALAECRALGAAVLPRGGGTSLAGQCANVAVVFDFSRYMTGLVSIDAAAKLAVVQPGIVLDTLRNAAEKYELTYGPDPATHSRCTLGGMIGNNSCGVHGLMAGKVVDNVECLHVALYDGTRMTVGRTSNAELERIIREGGRRGEIYAGLKGIRDRYADLVRAKFPKIPRRVSGYNLDELLPENGFNVARALVGTEGTCVTVLEAKLNLTKSPQHRVLTVLAFPDAFAAADAVPAALEHKPIGLEGFDQMLVDFMRRKGLASAQLQKLPPGQNFLLVEMGADSEEEAQEKSRRIAEGSQKWPVKPVAHICSPEEAESVWYVRESALGAVVFVPGEPDRCEGWEDSAVPPERLGDYLRAIKELMSEYGYSTPLYGHYGQGCVHMRVNFDYRSVEGLTKFREFMERATDVVLRFGGSLSGEHGDGQSRAALLPKMFGPELMEAFREFKRLWDPDNRMNPGKLVDAVRVYDPVENLRHLRWGQSPSADPRQEEGAGAKSVVEFEPYLAFAKDGGSLERATERCVGVGACRKTEGGVMCPSYRGTGEEKHSTRGRAHLLWEMLAGSLRPEGFQSEAVLESLDLCLSCKACKTECPVQVDMAAYKAEFLAQHYKTKMHPLQHYVFGFADKLARFGSTAPGLANAVLTGGLTSGLVKRLAGMARERKLPSLARKSFQKARVKGNSEVAHGAGAAKPVVLWPDTWNNYYHPRSLEAAETVLEAAGFRVECPREHVCCGRPLYDFGFLDQARAYLERVMEKVGAEVEAGLPFIFLEPSCASVFKDELLEFFPNDARAQKLSRQTWLLADWLAEKAPEWRPAGLEGAQVLVHGHCHHKAVFGGPASEIALLKKAGAKVEAIKAGCCGMAGPFGFEAEKYEVSKRIAQDGLMPAVDGAGPMTVLVADGFSCREQIEQLGHKQAVHFAEVLARGCGCGG